MIKQLLIGALLLLTSDLCLAQLEIAGKQQIVALESIVVLPSRVAQAKLAQLTATESSGQASVDDFGATASNASAQEAHDDSFIWGLVGNGIGFNKRF